MLIKGRAVPVCVAIQPLGRTCKVTAAECITSVRQGTKQPGGELQVGIASSAGMENLQSNSNLEPAD